MFTLAPLDRADPAAVEALLDEAFGADRRGRTAYRLRAGTEPVAAFSFSAWRDGELVGTLQSWPVEVAGDDGRVEPLLLVGPVAVRPDQQGAGIGKAMMAALLERADAAGETAMMLIGDPEYYGRLFGFVAAPTAGWRLPGPVERHRLLARLTGGRRLPLEGALRARIAASA